LAQHDAAAGGDDVALQAAQLRQHGGLAVAKARLTLRREDGADRLAIALLQHLVGVEPVPAQLVRQQSGDRALAAAARADQEEERCAHPLPLSSSSRMRTGERARLTTRRIISTGASRRVNSLNCWAAWRTNNSTPVMTWQPRARASLTSKVDSG